MQPDRLVEAHGQQLREVADAVYEGRAAFLGERFDGYAADTYYVRGVGYVCWPALTAGRFDAYDELCDRERGALDPLLDDGFELLADGLSSVVLTTPEGTGEYVVKIGRCGTGGGFGDGRRANLVEAQLSAAADPEAPIVPSVRCSARGEFAVYPLADRVGEAVENAEGGLGTVPELRAWLTERAPWLDVDEAVAPENRCVWQGRLRTLDYSHPGDYGEPLGVPEYVDRQRVIDRVEERRREGDKRDLEDGGGFVEPESSGA